MANYAKDDQILYHIELSKNMLCGAKYALLPGDPGRVEGIAKNFSNPQNLAMHREYTSWLCYCNSIPILVCSTGMGGPSVAIGMEELAQIGIENFIRVGTTGSIQKNIQAGDVIINDSAVRLDGTSSHYAPINYPAVADFELTQLLKSAAQKVALPYHLGTSASSDTFWAGQERYDSFTGYVLPEFQGSLQMWQQLGVLNYEMETATLFVVAKTFGLKAASICSVMATRCDGEKVYGKDVYDLGQQRIYSILKGMFENM